jgi:uncharacterized membrane protein
MAFPVRIQYYRLDIMKTFFTLFLLSVCCVTALCQSNADYYAPVFPRPVGVKQYTVESLLGKFGEVQINNRWYAGFDGFVRTDKNTIDNSFDDLIGTTSPATYGWGAVLGWVKNENWGVEVQYARSPIHNVLVINGDNPQTYKFTNDKNSLIIRGKRRLMFGKSSVRRSAFWISAGFGLIPNSGRENEYKEFYGYKQRGRRQAVDTLFMTSSTRTNKHVTGGLEASAEYVIKVSKSIDISLFARKQWGLGTSVTTNLDYFVNQIKTHSATIKGDGTGWNFGLSLRYVFEIGYDFENLNREEKERRL